MDNQIKTNYRYNFDKAENDTFSWSHWDGTSGGVLTHKPSGRRIYQMCWLTAGQMDEPVVGVIRDQAIAFWAALHLLQEQKPQVVDVAPQEPKHGENGYCRKCHSYCYGDCEAN